MKYILLPVGFIGFLVIILGLGFGGQWWDLQMQSYFQPKYEQVRRNTFETSRAFNEGMAQELSTMYRDYIKTKDQGEKDAIRSIVRERVAGYDLDSLNNPQVRAFAREMMQ